MLLEMEKWQTKPNFAIFIDFKTFLNPKKIWSKKMTRKIAD